MDCKTTTDTYSMCPLFDRIVNKFTNLEALDVLQAPWFQYEYGAFDANVFVCDILMHILMNFNNNTTIQKNLKYLNVTFAKSSLYKWLKNIDINGRNSAESLFQLPNLQHVSLGIDCKTSYDNHEERDFDTSTRHLAWEIISSIFGNYSGNNHSGENDSCDFDKPHIAHVGKPLGNERPRAKDSKQSKIKSLTLIGWDQHLGIRTMDVCNSICGANFANLQHLQIGGDNINVNMYHH